MSELHEDIDEKFDRLMEAVGEVELGSVLAIMAELSAHMVLDNLRVQHKMPSLGGLTVTESRLADEVFRPLINALRQHGFEVHGYPEDDPDWDAPIPFVMADNDDDGDDDIGLMFELGDE